MKFINYVADETRPSPLNLGVGRVFFGLYAIWKFGTQVKWDWLDGWPVPITDFTAFLVPPDSLMGLVAVEYWLTLLLLGLFTVGVHIGLTGFLSSLFVAHLSGAYYSIANSGTAETFIPISFVLMVFAVYRSDVVMSVDHFRRQASESHDRLTDRLESGEGETYSLTPLKWILVVTGVFYFLTGYAKVTDGSVFEWATGASMNRFMQRAVLRGYDSPFVDLFVSLPLVPDVSAVVSIVLEVGFLPVILAGFGISLFVVGLFVFHTAIALALTPFFFDQYFVLLLFFSWDSLHRRLSSSTAVDVVYDDGCNFCTRTLLQVDHFDLRDQVAYHPASDVPERFDSENHDVQNAMYAHVDGEAYRGYHAFRTTFGQLGFLRPVAFLMGLPVVRLVGERVYAYVAEHR